MEIRVVLECYTVEKAASIASEENIDVLTKAVKRIENSGDDPREFLLADMEFRIAIGESANLPQIGDLVKGVHRAVNKKLPVIFSASKKEKIAKSIHTAKNMLTYNISGQGRQAARCMRNRLSTINDDLKDELLQKHLQAEHS